MFFVRAGREIGGKRRGRKGVKGVGGRWVFGPGFDQGLVSLARVRCGDVWGLVESVG